MDRVSVIVTNYNGSSILRKTLPQLVETINPVPGEREIILVDDGSDDDSCAYVESNFPKVKIIALSENKGFINATNIGVNAAVNRVVILLNNDILVEPGFHLSLLKHFTDSDVFAVAPCCLADLNGKTVNESIVYLLPWDHESYLFIRMPDTDNTLSDLPGPVLYVSAGFGAFDREKFLDIGGLNKLYEPFYWEDVDMCFNAWRRGWQSIYDPAAKVKHFSHSTIGKLYDSQYVNKIFYRNFFYFTWKNFTKPEVINRYFKEYYRILSVYPQNYEIINPLLEALKEFESVLKSRLNDNNFRNNLNEDDIANIFREHVNKFSFNNSKREVKKCLFKH